MANNELSLQNKTYHVNYKNVPNVPILFCQSLLHYSGKASYCKLYLNLIPIEIEDNYDTIYSETCHLRPPYGSDNSGLKSQVVFHHRDAFLYVFFLLCISREFIPHAYYPLANS